MNIEEPKAMKEIHEIRLLLHEERKNLSREERVKRTNEIAYQVLKKLQIENRLVSEVSLSKIQY